MTLLVTGAPLALAQQPIEQQSISPKEDMGAITVRDNSEDQTIAHSSMAVTVVDVERFHGRNISLNDVLKRVAGVRLAQEGGFGSRATLAINGLEGNRVKVFIDGTPLNTPDGTFGINDIPIQLIERIEIYKGVVPARFGGDALGGAVNVVTREFEGSWVDATLSLGSYDLQRFTGVFKKRWHELGLEMGVGGFYNHAANDYVMKSPYIDGLEITRDHDEYTSMLYAFVGEVEDVWFDEISWELVRYESEKEIQGIEYNIQQARNESSLNFLGLSFEKADFIIPGLELEYDFGRPELTLSLIDKATTCYLFDGSKTACQGIGGEIDGIPHDSNDKQNEIRHDVNLHYNFNPSHAINLHLNSLYSEYTPSDALTREALGYDVGSFPSEKTGQVASLSYETAFFDSKWVNDIGVKSYHYDYTITSEERALSGTPQQTTSTGDKSGYYFSARYSPVENLYLKTSFEKTLRLPDSSEAFGNGVTISSSPELQPEEGKNFNSGILFDGTNIAGIPWLKAELNYFHRDISNMIKLISAHRTLKYENLGEIEVQGAELDVKTDITQNWYAYFNYTNQTLTDKQKYAIGSTSTLNPTYDLDVPNVPKQYANAGVEYKILSVLRDDSLLKLFWESSWADEYYYGWEMSQNMDRQIDAQTTHTAGFEYAFNNDELILGFEVRNLTDEDVTDVFNYPLMGRSYQLNLRYTWLQ